MIKLTRCASSLTQSPLSQEIGSAAMALIFKAGLATLDVRMAHYDITADPARAEYNEHCIFLVWHENVSVVFPQWSRSPLALLVSHHRDGEWLSRMTSRLGFNVVRGSSSRGGSSAIREIKNLSARTSFGITPDGPRGPRRRMVLGPVFLASRLKMPMVPVGIGYDRPFRLNSWDQFAIPRPFSRARVVFGPKIYVPERAKRDSLECYRVGTETLLNDLSQFAENWAEANRRIPNEKFFCRVRRCLELDFQQPSAPIPSSAENQKRTAA